MSKLVAALAVILLPFTLLAQDDKVNSNAIPPAIVKPARDFIMVQVGWNNWVQKPDSIKSKTLGYVFNAYLCYDFPIKKTNLSFAAGIGINSQVTFLDKQVISFNDTGTLGASARFLNDPLPYKRYKFATTYLQAPFELRYFASNHNRNRGFKAAIGLQVGTLLGAHTKGLRSVEGTNIKDKENTKRYISPWNFAATARVGWGNFSLFGSYNLTPVFKDNAGPVITPMAIGICITGL
ncbi:MAG: outer membrane beta-barrel protein [Bacteroidota bacterium]